MSPARTKKGRTARKGSPSQVQRKLKVGDRVRIVDISEPLKDESYDSRHAEHGSMRTAELFRFCVGREFTIQGFDRWGQVEIRADEDVAVRRKFGKWHFIYSEPEFLKRIGRQRLKARSKKKS